MPDETNDEEERKMMQRIEWDEISGEMESFKCENKIEGIFAAQADKQWAVRKMEDMGEMVTMHLVDDRGHVTFVAIGEDWEQCADWIGRMVVKFDEGNDDDC